LVTTTLAKAMAMEAEKATVPTESTVVRMLLGSAAQVLGRWALVAARQGVMGWEAMVKVVGGDGWEGLRAAMVATSVAAATAARVVELVAAMMVVAAMEMAATAAPEGKLVVYLEAVWATRPPNNSPCSRSQASLKVQHMK